MVQYGIVRREMVQYGMVQYGIVRRGFSPASERLSDNSQRNTGVFNDLLVTVQGISGQPLTGRKPDNSIPSLLLSDPAVSLLPAGFLFSRQISLLPPGFSFRVIEVISVNMRVRWWGVWSPEHCVGLRAHPVCRGTRGRTNLAGKWRSGLRSVALRMPGHTSSGITAPRQSGTPIAQRATYARAYTNRHFGTKTGRDASSPARNACPGIHKPTFQHQTGQDDTHLARNVCRDIHKPSTPKARFASPVCETSQTIHAKSPVCVDRLRKHTNQLREQPRRRNQFEQVHKLSTPRTWFA